LFVYFLGHKDSDSQTSEMSMVQIRMCQEMVGSIVDTAPLSSENLEIPGLSKF